MLKSQIRQKMLQGRVGKGIRRKTKGVDPGNAER